MFTKLRLMFDLLRSNSYVVLTDKSAVVSIPLMDMSKFTNIMLLSSQTIALSEFQTRLTSLIAEHKQEIQLLKRRNGSKLFVNGKTRVSKGKK